MLEKSRREWLDSFLVLNCKYWLVFILAYFCLLVKVTYVVGQLSTKPTLFPSFLPCKVHYELNGVVKREWNSMWLPSYRAKKQAHAMGLLSFPCLLTKWQGPWRGGNPRGQRQNLNVERTWVSAKLSAKWSVHLLDVHMTNKSIGLSHQSMRTW